MLPEPAGAVGAETEEGELVEERLAVAAEGLAGVAELVADARAGEFEDPAWKPVKWGFKAEGTEIAEKDFR